MPESIPEFQRPTFLPDVFETAIKQVLRGSPRLDQHFASQEFSPATFARTIGLRIDDALGPVSELPQFGQSSQETRVTHVFLADVVPWLISGPSPSDRSRNGNGDPAFQSGEKDEQPDDGDRPPAVPEGIAGREDCWEWMAKYLEWLKKHYKGDKQHRIIELNCGNVVIRYIGSDEDWIAYYLDDVFRAREVVAKGISNPADESWKKESDESVPDWEVREEKLTGQPTWRLSGEKCRETVVRVTNSVEFTVSSPFKFAHTYKVPDKGGGADPDAIDQVKRDVEYAMRRAIGEAFFGDPLSGVKVKDSGCTYPNWKILQARLNEVALQWAKFHFDCSADCVLRTELISYKDLNCKQPQNVDQSFAIKVRVRAGAPVRRNGYWEVEVAAEGSIVVDMTATIVYDVYCEDKP